MSKEGEEILQVFNIFRHGKRDAFVNLETNEQYDGDLSEDSIINTINKGRNFIKKYFSKFPSSPFNPKDFKCIISNSIRTMKSCIYRLVNLLPNVDIKTMNMEEVKEFTIKNIPNTVYDDKIFLSYAYTDPIVDKYCNSDPNYQNLFTEIEDELSKKSPKAVEIFKRYLVHPYFHGKAYEHLKICFIWDFLCLQKPEIEKTFSDDQKLIREVMTKLNSNKRMIDVNLANKNANFCFCHQLICNYYYEIDKLRKNADDKKKIILLSAHDLYLKSFLNFFEVKEVSKFKYYFDDEINLIIFRKKGDMKLYFRLEYNDEELDIPMSNLKNKKECELDVLMDKIEKEYLIYTYNDIIDFCKFKTNKEFYPSK